MKEAGRKQRITPSGEARQGLNVRLAGWSNAVLALLTGGFAAIGFVAGGPAGTESPFFVLVASLLAAVALFLRAGRPVPATILAMSLLLLGLFVGVGLMVGGTVLGAPQPGFTMVVAVAALLLAGLEAWSIAVVWRRHPRRTQVNGRADTPS